MTFWIWAPIIVVVGLAGYVRLAPSDPGRWHVDPLAAEPGRGRFVVRPDGGDRTGPVLDMTPVAALARFAEVAEADPRTHRLAGSPGEGRITYVTRSRWAGFPDYTTVAAVPVTGGTTLAVFARLRFGADDFGVNRARVSGWLDRMRG